MSAPVVICRLFPSACSGDMYSIVPSTATVRVRSEPLSISLALELADCVKGDNVRVIELCDRFGLGEETLHLCAASQASGSNHLYGDRAIDTDLTRAKH